jgi:Rhodopirellula transposase DDE domain
MEEGVRWTNLTRSEIAAGMAKEGFPVSVTVVDRLLDESGFRLRKPQKVKTMAEAENRDAQFKKIERLKADYQRAGQPILSMDTKSREILGTYARSGRVFSTAPLPAWDHDFPTRRLGVVIPHGLFDLGRNEGFMHLGTSHDTSVFAADALWDWWRRYGCHRYPFATKLLLLCDGGGSNGYRRLLFKQEIQDVAAATGLEIRVAHYPTHCSKYNPIDHRLFPHLTRVCQGMFLKSAEMVRDLMRKATTRTGLRVFATIVDRIYDLGVEPADDFLNDMHMRVDRLLPDWNYVLLPS